MKTDVTVVPFVEWLHGTREGFLSYLLQSTKGRVFSVEFVKKDGSFRKANARTFIKGSVLGTGRARDWSFIDNNVYLKFLEEGYEKEKAAQMSWRSFRPESIRSFRIGGRKYVFPVQLPLGV